MRAIAILGGGLIKHRGKWRTIGFMDSEHPEKAGGSKIRVLAGSILYKKSPRLIIASGGRNKFYKSIGSPNVSSVMRRELIDLKVRKQDIVESPRPKNTYQEIESLKTLVKTKGIESISIISNRYHLPRIKALIRCGPGEKLHQLTKIAFISAESVIMKYGTKKLKDTIKRAYEMKSMRDKVKLEIKGLREIRNGTYKFK